MASRVIGTSEYAAAIGHSDLTSRTALWRQMTGNKTEAENSPNEKRDNILEHGNEYEHRAVAAAEEVLGQMFWATGDDQQQSTVIIDDVAHRSTPDGIGIDSNLEVKCPVGDMYDTVPLRYLIQCQGQMTISQMDPGSESKYKTTFCAWKQNGTSTGLIKCWQILHSPAFEKVIMDEVKVFLELCKDRENPPPRFSSKKNPKVTIPYDQIIVAEVYPEFRMAKVGP